MEDEKKGGRIEEGWKPKTKKRASRTRTRRGEQRGRGKRYSWAAEKEEKTEEKKKEEAKKLEDQETNYEESVRV